MILLDTDVFIDVALDRRPYSDLASELLDRIEHGAEAAYIAWYSVSNLYYLAAPALGGVSARLRRPVHSHQERQGLRTLSNPCGRPAGGADRVVLMVGDSVPSSNAVARCRRGQNGGRLKGLRFVDYRVEGGRCRGGLHFGEFRCLHHGRDNPSGSRGKRRNNRDSQSSMRWTQESGQVAKARSCS